MWSGGAQTSEVEPRPPEALPPAKNDVARFWVERATVWCVDGRAQRREAGREVGDDVGVLGGDVKRFVRVGLRAESAIGVEAGRARGGGLRAL